MDPTFVIAAVVVVGTMFLLGVLLGLQAGRPRRRRGGRRRRRPAQRSTTGRP